MPHEAIEMWASSTTASVLLLVSCLIFLLCLPATADVVPSLLRCILSARESENLSDSMSLCRNRAFLSLLVPTVLVTAFFDLYPPVSHVPVTTGILLNAGVIASYFLLRALMKVLGKAFTREGKISPKEWKCATGVPLTFFVIAEIVITLTAALSMYTGGDAAVTRKVILWEIGFIYALCLLREAQIFFKYRGLVPTFLYLCTLEFIPTGILVVSAIELTWQ